MIGEAYQAPSAAHLLGTDGYGRSVLAALFEATLQTCASVTLAVFIAAAIGISVGTIAALSKSRAARALCESAVTLSYSTPLLLALMLILSVAGDRFWIFPAVAGCIGWGGIALATSTSVSQVARAPYVLASEALGASVTHNLRAHILPNARPGIRAACLAMFAPMTQLSVLLAFIGVGGYGLGSMIRQGYDIFPSCWWVWLPAALVCIGLLSTVALATRTFSQG